MAVYSGPERVNDSLQINIGLKRALSAAEIKQNFQALRGRYGL